MYVCRPSPSNQSFYRLIAGYQRGTGDHRVGQWWEGSWAYKFVICMYACMYVCGVSSNVPVRRSAAMCHCPSMSGRRLDSSFDNLVFETVDPLPHTRAYTYTCIIVDLYHTKNTIMCTYHTLSYTHTHTHYRQWRLILWYLSELWYVRPLSRQLRGENKRLGLLDSTQVPTVVSI
jgi:hypothetical protein